jgi:predicted deacetylase
MKKLIVSVHDVAPEFEGQTREILQELDKRKIKKSILVVPKWHDDHNNDMRYAGSFVDDLLQHQADGDEILQHGCTHNDDVRKYNYNFARWFMGRFSKGCAEFHNEDYGTAYGRIAIGKQILEDSGFNDIIGFVAPGWLVNQESRDAIKDSGFAYHVYTTFEDITFRGGRIPIEDFRTEGEIRSKEIGFDGSRISWDLITRFSAYLNASPSKDTLRFAIHPQDLQGTKPFGYALKLIDKVIEGRESCTYRELLE